VNIYTPAPILDPKGVFSALIMPIHHITGYT